MKFFRIIGSLAFVIGLFTAVFVGGIWHVCTEPTLPWWLKIAIYCFLGGILLVLLTVALEQKKGKAQEEELPIGEMQTRILLQNSAEVPGSEITKNLGLVKGHTIYAIWIGKDLSAIVRLVLGGELIINIRFVTTSVIGSAAELLAYGTAVKLKKAKT